MRCVRPCCPKGAQGRGSDESRARWREQRLVPGRLHTESKDNGPGRVLAPNCVRRTAGARQAEVSGAERSKVRAVPAVCDDRRENRFYPRGRNVVCLDEDGEETTGLGQANSRPSARRRLLPDLQLSWTAQLNLGDPAIEIDLSHSADDGIGGERIEPPVPPDHEREAIG